MHLYKHLLLLASISKRLNSCSSRSRIIWSNTCVPLKRWGSLSEWSLIHTRTKPHQSDRTGPPKATHSAAGADQHNIQVFPHYRQTHGNWSRQKKKIFVQVHEREQSQTFEKREIMTENSHFSLDLSSENGSKSSVCLKNINTCVMKAKEKVSGRLENLKEMVNSSVSILICTFIYSFSSIYLQSLPHYTNFTELHTNTHKQNKNSVSNQTSNVIDKKKKMTRRQNDLTCNYNQTKTKTC